MKSNFEKKSENIREVITNIKKEIELFSEGIGEDNPYLKTFLKYQNIQALARSLLTELVDKIYIKEGKEIIIAFRFDNQQKSIVEFIESNII